MADEQTSREPWMRYDPEWTQPWQRGVLRMLEVETAWITVQLHDGESHSGFLTHVDSESLLLDAPLVLTGAERGRFVYIPRDQLVTIQIEYVTDGQGGPAAT